MVKTGVVVSIIVALVLVVVGLFLLQSPSETKEEQIIQSVSSNNQEIIDNKVLVSEIISDGLGWIVIHANNEGKPGTIIGNSDFLSSGETRDFSINLTRASVDGEQLFAMPHKDNGDDVFNAADDTPVQDEEGNVMFMKFFISVDAEEPSAVSL